MDYILHRRYKGKMMCGQEVNLPALTNLTSKDKAIYYEGKPFCYSTSQVAHEYISRNDDGQGLERGAYTYEIAFSNRKRFNKDKTRCQRFTDEELELICSKWQKFIIPDIDVVLFNQTFFEADLNELKEMAKDLHITVKGVV